jgi:hypothetical protein
MMSEGRRPGDSGSLRGSVSRLSAMPTLSTPLNNGEIRISDAIMQDPVTSNNTEQIVKIAILNSFLSSNYGCNMNCPESSSNKIFVNNNMLFLVFVIMLLMLK